MRRPQWQVVRVFEAAPFGGIALLGELLSTPTARLGLGELAPALSGFAIAAFAFLFNDLQDAPADQQSPAKADRPLVAGTLRRGRAWLTAVLLIASALALPVAAPTPVAMAICAALLLLSAAYSWRPRAGKTIPVVASALHVAGATGTFLLGAWWHGVGDARAVAIGIAFGLLFAAGHLHQEVQDIDDDRAAGVRTLAVRLGARPVLWIGFALFGIAFLHFGILSAIAWLPPAVGTAPGGAYVIYVAGFFLIGRDGPTRERLVRLRRLYRLAYAVAGLVMLAAALGPRPWE